MALSVRTLSLTPVKGLRIREVAAIELGPDGARGDRAFYVVDADGQLVNGKRLGALHRVSAEYLPGDDGELSLTFPDGSRATAPVRLGPEVQTRFFSTPRPARVLDGPWAQALSRFAGQPLRIVAGGPAQDRAEVGRVSLVSRASLRRLAEVGATDGGDGVDARRFRMLVELDGADAHAEDEWVGRELALGDGGARVRVRGHVGRCVTTTRSPDSGEVDLPTLQLLAEYRLDEPTSEPLAFGVHGEVLAAGRVRVGDAVTLAGRRKGSG